MKKTNEKGITLISLILTIVILLIIACVIDVVVSDEVFDKAEKAEEDTRSDINASQNRIENIINSLPVISESLSISSVILNSKTTDSFVVDALATSSEAGNLTYSLYLEGNSTPVSTKTVGNDGSLVQLTANGLAEYTEYRYYVKITDTTNSVQSKISTVRTKCSGRTDICTTTLCTIETSTCITCKGTGWSDDVCTTCDGTGVYCLTCNGISSFVCGGTLSVSGASNADKNAYCYVCGTRLTTMRYALTCATCSFSAVTCRDCYSTVETCPGEIDCTGCSGGTSIPQCTTCQGNKKIDCSDCDGGTITPERCIHGETEPHMTCECPGYTITQLTEHYKCEHNSNGVEHE